MSPQCCSQPVPLHRWSPRSPPRKRQRPRWARRGFCYRRGTWACEGRTTAAPGSRCPPTGIIYRLEKSGGGVQDCLHLHYRERKTLPAEVRVILATSWRPLDNSDEKFQKGDQNLLIISSSCVLANSFDNMQWQCRKIKWSSSKRSTHACAQPL